MAVDAADSDVPGSETIGDGVVSDPGRADTGRAVGTGAVVGLKTRPQFLAVAGSGRRWITKAFILQAAPDMRTDGRIGLGFTASRKVGKAVIRNRAKRRLRALCQALIPDLGTVGWHYVLIARSQDTELPFTRLEKDLRWALSKLAAGADLKPRPDQRPTQRGGAGAHPRGGQPFGTTGASGAPGDASTPGGSKAPQ